METFIPHRNNDTGEGEVFNLKSAEQPVQCMETFKVKIISLCTCTVDPTEHLDILSNRNVASSC